MLTFLHWEQSSFKAHISITTRLNVLIFAVYVENASFKCSVRFILNIFIIVWLYLSWKNATCTTFWTGAVVRLYYGNWKWCCSYIVCHKPIKFGHLVGNKLYFTLIMTFIPIEGKSKSYKHSLIIYWTALVHSKTLDFVNCWYQKTISNPEAKPWRQIILLSSCGSSIHIESLTCHHYCISGVSRNKHRQLGCACK